MFVRPFMTGCVLGLCVLMTSSSTAALPRPQSNCVIRGNALSAEKVTVRPKGARAFTIGLSGAKAKAILPVRAGAPVELEVETPLVFRAQSNNLWLTVNEPYTSPDGLVELRKGAHLVNARAEGDMVVASAVLYAHDVLPGEDKHPDESASFVRVPCRAVVAGALESTDFVEARGTDGRTEENKLDAEEADEWWGFRSEIEKIQLRARPHVNAPALLLSPTEVKRLRTEGDWMLVEREGEGVTVRGWVRASQFKKLPEVVGFGRSYGCTGNHPTADWGEGWGPKGPPANMFQGEAKVLAGTPVFAAPPKGEWAVFTADTIVIIRHVQGEKWVELRSVPGLDGTPPGSPWLNARVALEAIVFPEHRVPDGDR